MTSTAEIRAQLSSWIAGNPLAAGKLLSAFLADAPDRKLLEIISSGHEAGIRGLPEIDDRPFTSLERSL